MEIEAVKKISVGAGDTIYVRYKFGNMPPGMRNEVLNTMKNRLTEIFPNNHILLSGEEVDITVLTKEDKTEDKTDSE